MHLHRVRASVAKLSRNPLLVQERVKSYFFPENYKPFPLPPSERSPWFPTNAIAVFRFQVENVLLQVFEGAQSESTVHSG